MTDSGQPEEPETFEDGSTSKPPSRWRMPLLVLAALRYAIPLAALPLAPALIAREQYGLLTVLRPGREVLLLAGGVTRTSAESGQLLTSGNPGLLVAFLAFLPLMVGGVWVFFALGRAWSNDLREENSPDWFNRMVPPEQFELARKVLTRRGPLVALVARVSGLPPTIVGAAAGTSDVNTWSYLAADLAGAILAFGIGFGVGMGLGQAYERGGPWLTGAMLAMVVLAAVLVMRWARAEAQRT